MHLEAYAVGGVVRDYFLQRHCSDIDIVCVGSGIALAQEVARRISPTLEVHVFKTFGTAQLHYHYDGIDWEVEFVGARRESYQHDSRKPIVEDGTLEDDQNRRDFTVNAMAVCLNHDRFGELVDPFGGIRDLNDGILRTPLDPDITFSDDPLRMMRAIRFASQLGFTIEERCFQAICDNAERLKIVSNCFRRPASCSCSSPNSHASKASRPSTDAATKTTSTTPLRWWTMWRRKATTFGCDGPPCSTTSANPPPNASTPKWDGPSTATKPKGRSWSDASSSASSCRSTPR